MIIISFIDSQNIVFIVLNNFYSEKNHIHWFIKTLCSLYLLIFLINVRIRNTYVGKQFYQGNFEYFIISCKIRISTKCRFRFSPDLRGPKFARTFFSSHFLQLVFFKFLFGKIVFIFTVAMFALWISRQKNLAFSRKLGISGQTPSSFFPMAVKVWPDTRTKPGL